MTGLIGGPFVAAEQRKMPTVYLASTSQEKADAVRDGWNRIRPEQPIDLVTQATDSGVPEQPLNEDVMRGAHNRLRALQNRVGQTDGYLVAFESGIWVEKSDRYADYGEEATLCLVSRGDTTVLARSDGRRYPYHVVTKARKEGIATLKEHDKLVSAWFKENPAPPGGKSRRQVMAEAFAAALAKL